MSPAAGFPPFPPHEVVQSFAPATQKSPTSLCRVSKCEDRKDWHVQQLLHLQWEFSDLSCRLLDEQPVHVQVDSSPELSRSSSSLSSSSSSPVSSSSSSLLLFGSCLLPLQRTTSSSSSSSCLLVTLAEMLSTEEEEVDEGVDAEGLRLPLGGLRR